MGERRKSREKVVEGKGGREGRGRQTHGGDTVMMGEGGEERQTHGGDTVMMGEGGEERQTHGGDKMMVDRKRRQRDRIEEKREKKH